MTTFIITVSGYVTVNGNVIPDGSCSGIPTPAVIDGTGEFFVACCPNPPNAIIGPEGITYEPAPDVCLTLLDEEAGITTIPQNTRYPEEGSYPLSRPVWVF